jgi:hypothetical protein
MVEITLGMDPLLKKICQQFFLDEDGPLAADARDVVKATTYRPRLTSIGREAEPRRPSGLKSSSLLPLNSASGGELVRLADEGFQDLPCDFSAVECL